ncbi:hypothetical protein [Ruficoccus sp. ZRK36]|uniref:hypothetical protein n=1 Tax=Ruficoccus sp. ZRK36 TaxID=2866311 RepID=UPI001C7312C9|nr:hypothetical protein [Ruficoccus sp. ZRK36]QYY34998.1 hypothetical protein K0V07_11885 [Ruficoccus sp. ZRK36]
MAKREQFKSFNEIDQPDGRWSIFVICNEHTGEERRYSHREHYDAIQEIEIKDSVPTAVYHHFLTAKHLLLYAWQCYRFTPVASMQAYSAVEMALRKKCEIENIPIPKWRGLKQLLELAEEKGWISNHRFHIYNRQVTEHLRAKSQGIRSNRPKDYLGVIKGGIPRMRNAYAHGSTSLDNSMIEVITCGEIINQLF